MQSPTFALVFIAVFCAVSINAAILQPKQGNAVKQEDKTPVTLDDILQSRLSASGFGGSWVPDSDDLLRVISGNSITHINVASNANTTIVSPQDITARFGNQSVGLSVSPDGQYVLVEHSRRSVWRHSYLAKYDVFNHLSKNWTKLEPQGNEGGEQEELQLVVWDASGHSLAFVYENNIYYLKDHGSATSVQITRDGGNATFNGISDWVYEEEMFGSPVAMWFSTDNSNLAFVKFDDAEVEFYQWPLYGEPGVRDTVYPKYEPIRYPKTGTKNPVVSLNVANLAGLANPTPYRLVSPPAMDQESLIATVTWANNTHLILQMLNRHQNESYWNLCDSGDGECRQIYIHTQAGGWIDVNHPKVSQDGSKFLVILPVRQPSDPAGRSYKHVVSLSTNGQPTQSLIPLTSGAMHVDGILGWHEAGNKLYFTGTGLHPEVSPLADPTERHIYSVNPSGTNTVPDCISCNIKTDADEECQSHTVSYSANYTYFMHSCRGPGVPEKSTKRSNDSSVVRMWQNNAALRERLTTKLLPTSRDMEVDIPGGFKAKVRLYLPPDFNENMKYPLLIDVYAGPDSQKLTQDYKADWGTYLTSSLGIIYGSIDGRGSGRQSAEQIYSVYRNLGSAEIEDQISVTKHLVQTLNYIDANKTAIWGWSYGGYATAMVLGKDTENVFKCGISVAPVTSWLYYDTIYTERYMGLPSDDDNWSGYNASSVMNHLENFRSKQFLLIHGNADDNVHYQQSMMLSRAMEKADIMFNSLSYPEENHGINGAGMRRHLYHSIERFLMKDCQWENDEPNNSKSSTSSVSANIYVMLMMIVTAVIQYPSSG